MILHRTFDSYWLCDIEPMPSFTSEANITEPSELKDVRNGNTNAATELSAWKKKFEICRKFETLPEHNDYFKQFQANEELVEDMDYLIAKVYQGGRSVKDGNGVPYDYHTYYKEIAVPIGEDISKYTKPPVLSAIQQSTASYIPLNDYLSKPITVESPLPKKEKVIIDWDKIGTKFALACKKKTILLPIELEKLSETKLLSIINYIKLQVEGDFK